MRRLSRAVMAMALSAFVCAASEMQAAEIAGQAVLAGRGAMREAVVYLEDNSNGGGKALPLPKAVVDQRDKTFLPHVSVVPRGTTVQFPNHDTVFHNVYAYFN